MRSFLLLISIFYCSQIIKAQTSAPKYSNEFLKIGVGARAAGMGNSQVSSASDVTSGYWNPAGLMGLDAPEIGLMHSEYFAGIAKYDYGAFATPLQKGRRFGASFIRFGIDDIPNTLNFKDGNTFNYDKLTSFSIADMALILSYAQNLNGVEGLSVGANAKIVNRLVGDFATAWGFGLDVGVKLKRDNFSLGATVFDLTTTFNAWSFNTELFEQAFAQTGNEIPQNSIELTLPSLALGGNYLFFKDKKMNLLTSLDLHTHFDGKRSVIANLGPVSLDPKVGIEASYNKLIYLRAGAYNFQSIPNLDGKKKFTLYPTAGLGINLFNIVQIDYALSNIGNFSSVLYSHLFSLKFNMKKIFNKGKNVGM